MEFVIQQVVNYVDLEIYTTSDPKPHPTFMLRFLTAWTMISTTVVVLPVPGGPWTMATSLWHKANFTACLCESSRLGLKNTQGFSSPSVKGCICNGGPGDRFPNSTLIKWAAGPSLYLVKVSSALKVKRWQISHGQFPTYNKE